MASQRKKPAAVGIKARLPGFIEPALAKRSQPPIALESSGPRSTGAAQRRIGGARTIGGGDAHRVFTAAQNCSVTAVVSSVTFQPFVSAFSFANFCSF